MELRDVLAALRTGWLLVLLGILLGGGVALGVSVTQTPLYTSSTELFVSTTDDTNPAAIFQGSQFSQDRVTSYARLITGESLAGRVIDRLGLQMSPRQLAAEVSATPVANTVLIDVSVTDPSAERAQQIARAIGTEFTSMATELEATGQSGSSPVKVTVTQDPDVPSSPSSPKQVRNVALGLVVGLLVGALIAIARARLDRSVKTVDEALELAGAPVVGTVLRDEALGKVHMVDRAPESRAVEDFRKLRNSLQFLNVDNPPRVIMVSSALPSEGKTTMILNLGLALAETGRRVVILETDLRRPKVTSYLGVVGDVGLTNVLVGAAQIAEVTQAYGTSLSVIAAGPTPPNPGELLASSQMTSVIEKLRSEYEYVLVDAPPLLPVADASGLAVHTDGVLLSTRYGHTRKDQLRQASVTLQGVGATILGVVLNLVPRKAEMAYGYGYDYGYTPGRHAKA